MSIFYDAKWIWENSSPKIDEYAEFLIEFDFFGKDLSLNISADSNYAVYLNGRLCCFGQYPDYPHFKIYDKRDLFGFARKGKNVLAIRVWYYGIDNSSTYWLGKAGLIFALESGGRPLAVSGVDTPSRLSPTYKQGVGKRITGQLGLTFEYSADGADGWMYACPAKEHPFTPSVLTGFEPAAFKERTCLPTRLGEFYEGLQVSADKLSSISPFGSVFDLGSEQVGFVTLEFTASSKGTLVVAFGEHIADGRVRRQIGGRDFSFTYNFTEGKNYFMNPFRRFGLRYIELIPDSSITDTKVGLISVDYPVFEEEPTFELSPRQREIYDACVHTLKLCMHEHYEDSPWREQALYAMDSRNQMLCGYYAFSETVFPKSNLELISVDRRTDGMLSICYPSTNKLAIPSFSLHYIIECEEYLRYSSDTDLLRTVYPKMQSIVDTFVKRIGEDGMLYPPYGSGIWNFYEWEEDLDGSLSQIDKLTAEPNLLLTCLLIIALKKLSFVEQTLGLPITDDGISDRLIEGIRSRLYDPESGLYFNSVGSRFKSRLGNSLAVLAGVPENNDDASSIVSKLVCGAGLTDTSLSMRCFLYDAILAIDEEKYADFVLSDIERTYLPMLSTGNNTVWETVLGERDFNNAGSLCHGWSALPIYYYHKLIGKEDRRILK